MTRQVQTSNNDKTLIKQIMRDKGITVAELADRMGKAQPTISNLLAKQNMTIDTLNAFAEALEVEVADLFPVSNGYVHYSEKRKRLMGDMWGEKTNKSITSASKASPTAPSAAPTAQPAVQAVAFCPHCGAKVEVGVVLLAR